MTDWQLKTIGLKPDTKRLVPGDRVQLGFCNGNSDNVQEHLWVRTSQVLWKGKYYFGVLEEDAKSIDGLYAVARVINRLAVSIDRANNHDQLAGLPCGGPG